MVRLILEFSAGEQRELGVDLKSNLRSETPRRFLLSLNVSRVTTVFVEKSIVQLPSRGLRR